MAHPSSSVSRSTSYAFFKTLPVAKPSDKSEIEEPTLAHPEMLAGKPIVCKKSAVENRQMLLNEGQKEALNLILIEKHIIESAALNVKFSISAIELLNKLKEKLSPKECSFSSTQFSYNLIGSRAGSLFRPLSCNDTDILIQCKVKIDPEYLKRYESLKHYFSFSTKLLLDEIRDHIEYAVKELYEESDEISHKLSLSLKDIWFQFFTKRKIENDPIFSLEEGASNRYGVIHVGKTLELKYCIDYEIGSSLIAGLLNPCSFIQDDLRISLDPLLESVTYEGPIVALSIENPIKKVIKSLLANELLTDNPDGSKFFSHLTKLTLKEGITTKSHIERNFILLLESMDLDSFEARLINALSSKTPFEKIMCIINCFNLSCATSLDSMSKELLSVKFEAMLIDQLHARAQALSLTLPRGALIEWISLMLLLTSDSTKKEFCFLSYEESLFQLITPKDPLFLLLSLLKKGFSKDEFYELYKVALPSRTLDAAISDANQLIKALFDKLKDHLQEGEMRLLCHVLLFNNEELFHTAELGRYLQESQDSYLRYSQEIIISPIDGQIYSCKNLFEDLFITNKAADIKEATPSSSKAFILFDIPFPCNYGFEKISPFDSKQIVSLLETIEKAFDPIIDAFGLKLLMLLDEETIRAEKTLILNKTFTYLSSLINLEPKESLKIELLKIGLALSKKVLSDEEYQSVCPLFIDFEDNFFRHIVPFLASNPHFAIKHLSLFLIKQAGLKKFIISKEDVKETLINALISLSSHRELALEAVHTVEALLLFDESSIENIIILSIKSKCAPLSVEHLSRIHHVLEKPLWPQIKNCDHKNFIIDSTSEFLAKLAPFIKTRTELNKIKEILFLLKINVKESNTFFEETAAIIFAQLLEVSFTSWQDTYMALFFDALRCNTHKYSVFCLSIAHSFNTYLKTIDVGVTRVFLKKLATFQPFPEKFDELFSLPIEKLAIHFIQTFDLSQVVQLKKELKAPKDTLSLAPLVHAKLKKISENISQDGATENLKKFIDSGDVKEFLAFDEILDCFDDLALKFLVKSQLILATKPASEKDLQEGRFILKMAIKLAKLSSKKDSISPLKKTFYFYFIQFLNTVSDEEATSPLIKQLYLMISFHTECLESQIVDFKCLLSHLIESDRPSLHEMAYQFIEMIGSKNLLSEQQNFEIFLMLIAKAAEDKTSFKTQDLFIKVAKSTLFTSSLLTKEKALAIKMVLENFETRQKSLITNEKLSSCISALFSSKNFKQPFFDVYFRAHPGSYALVIKRIIEDPLLASCSTYSYLLLKTMMLYVSEDFDELKSLEKEENAEGYIAKAARLETNRNGIKGLICQFVLSKHIDLEVSNWLDFLNIIINLRLDFFLDDRDKKINTIFQLKLAIVSNLKSMRSIDFKGKLGSEYEKMFTQAASSIKEMLELCLDDDYFLGKVINYYPLEMSYIISFMCMAARFEASLSTFITSYLKRINLIKAPIASFYKYKMVCINGALRGLQFFLEYKESVPDELLMELLNEAKEPLQNLDLNEFYTFKMYEEFAKLALQLMLNKDSHVTMKELFDLVASLKCDKVENMQLVYRYLIEKTAVATSHFEQSSYLFKIALSQGIINASSNKELFLSIAKTLDFAKKKSILLSSTASRASISTEIEPLRKDLLEKLLSSYEDILEQIMDFSSESTAQLSCKAYQLKVVKIITQLRQLQTLEMHTGRLPMQFYEITRSLLEVLELVKQNLAEKFLENKSELHNQILGHITYFLSKRTSALNTPVYYRIFGANLFSTIKEIPNLCNESIKSYIDWLATQGLNIEDADSV